jgi:hypothetical protein
MYLYVFITWLLANLIHPIVFSFFMGNDSDFLGGDILGFYFLILAYSLFISCIGLLLSFLIIHLISKIAIGNENKFICWLISAPMVIVLNLWLLLAFLGDGDSMELSNYELAIPSMIAVAIIIVVRFRYFFKAIEQVQEKNKSNEQ